MKVTITGQEIGKQLGLFPGMGLDAGVLHYILNEKSIYSLEVTPVPVEVPRMFDNWVKLYGEKEWEKEYMIMQIIFACFLGDNYAEYQMSIKLISYVKKNLSTILNAIQFGYKVKPERMWKVRVPHTDSLLYSKSENGNITIHFSINDDGCEFTSDELKQYHLDGNDVERIEVER